MKSGWSPSCTTTWVSSTTETCRLEPVDNPGSRSVTYVSGINRRRAAARDVLSTHVSHLAEQMHKRLAHG